MSTIESADAEEAAAEASSRMSRGARIATIIGAVVGLVIAIWIGLELAGKPVRWRDVGFNVASPTVTTATFDVFLYSDDDAVCRVRALSASYTEVGIADVPVARADGAEQRITVTIATVAEATTAVVDACYVP